ncbi:NYN domain-containing protein [Neisseria dentiae]|uniref:NYN domain-containing protein n=3 Tax=Neisseria dentiae TaxID=194197 RepID=UPI0035A1D349
MNITDKKLAVLIDADNAPADIIDRLLEEIAKYGIASVKRIYGDWSHGLNKWKAALLPHAIIPVQQFAYTKGKNATDMALVIDAMDLLYSGNFDGFCIVSSDSDFTRLASRLRESGLTVYGFGEKKTPEAFRKACDKFIHTEIFRPEKSGADKSKNSGKTKPAAETGSSAPDAATLIKRAVRENADDLGWANLGPIGSYINKINPDFDPRLYGFSKLSELIKSFDIFEWRTDNNQIQVRRRTVAEKNGRPSESKSNAVPKTEVISDYSSHTLTETTPLSVATSSRNRKGTHNSQTETAVSIKQTAETATFDEGIAVRTQAKNLINTISSALELDGNLLDSIERHTIQTAISKLESQMQAGSTEHIRAAVSNLIHVSESFAKKRIGSNVRRASASKQEEAAKSQNVSKPTFTKLIPLVQQAVDAAADEGGWARLGDVLKQLAPTVNPHDYGFDTDRALIHAIYSDWLEIKKAGRGERVRVNKRFVSKD